MYSGPFIVKWRTSEFDRPREETHNNLNDAARLWGRLRQKPYLYLTVTFDGGEVPTDALLFFSGSW